MVSAECTFNALGPMVLKWSANLGSAPCVVKYSPGVR